MTPSRTDMYIEEPEAHIYPSTQKDFIYSLVNLLNGRRKHFCFIATHSPYILTALNNLIQAAETISESDEKAAKIKDRFPKRQTMPYDEVAAFEELVGSHGGLGGTQTKPFIMHPSYWKINDDLIGAESIYHLLKRELENLKENDN